MDIISAMKQDTGREIRDLRVDGGATDNKFLMQFQSDILGLPVLLPEIRESTALGAAYLAGLSSGIYSSIEEIAVENRLTKRFEPVMNRFERERQVKLWGDAVKRLL
jgi:glycerol kinase